MFSDSEKFRHFGLMALSGLIVLTIAINQLI